MTHKHTPAPWEVKDGSIIGNDYRLADIPDYEYSDGEYQANAQLMASAPELLAALEGLYNAIEGGVKNLNPQMEKAIKAINKATGGK